MRGTFSATVMAIAMGVAVAQGQAVRQLGSQEAVALALAQHPEIAAVRAARPVGVLTMQAASVLPSPEFRFSSNGLAVDPELLNARMNASIRWSPPRPREIALRQQAAQARQRQVEAEIQGAEVQLAAAVRDAYRRAALARQRADLAERNVALRAEMLQVVRRQVANGIKEAVEADMAELALGDAEADKRRATTQAASEHRKLARLIDPKGTMVFAVTPDRELLGPLQAPPEGAAAARRALTARPELAARTADCESTDVQRTVASNQRYPWLSFVQVSRRLDASSTGPWSFQVGVDLPVFRSSAAVETSLAGARAARCRLELEALRTRVRVEAEEAAAAMQQAAKELAHLEGLAGGAAARAVERAREAVANGRADRLELLTAEARQLSLRDRWLQQRLEYAALEERLELAVGGTDSQ